MKQHTLNIPDHSGHNSFQWTPGDKVSVAEAEKLFDEKKREGFAAFDTSNPEDQKLIRSFDESVETITMIPQFAGG